MTCKDSLARLSSTEDLSSEALKKIVRNDYRSSLESKFIDGIAIGEAKIEREG